MFYCVCSPFACCPCPLWMYCGQDHGYSQTNAMNASMLKRGSAVELWCSEPMVSTIRAACVQANVPIPANVQRFTNGTATPADMCELGTSPECIESNLLRLLIESLTSSLELFDIGGNIDCGSTGRIKGIEFVFGCADPEEAWDPTKDDVAAVIAAATCELLGDAELTVAQEARLEANLQLISNPTFARGAVGCTVQQGNQDSNGELIVARSLLSSYVGNLLVPGRRGGADGVPSGGPVNEPFGEQVQVGANVIDTGVLDMTTRLSSGRAIIVLNRAGMERGRYTADLAHTAGLSAMAGSLCTPMMNERWFGPVGHHRCVSFLHPIRQMFAKQLNNHIVCFTKTAHAMLVPSAIERRVADPRLWRTGDQRDEPLYNPAAHGECAAQCNACLHCREVLWVPVELPHW